MAKNMRIIDLIMKVPAVDPKALLERLKKVRHTTIAVIVVLAALPALFGLYGFVQMVGSQKIYCLNCHVNQRNMNFWQKSKLHPDINCASCHKLHGKGMLASAFHFEFSSKEDNVSANCEGCHKDDIDKPVGSEAAGGKRPKNELIRIPHAKHIKELGIKCTFCHDNIFHERRPEKYATYRPTMDACYSCHDEATTPCTQCHPDGMPSTPSMSGKVGGGRISYAAGGSEVSFDHKKHQQMGLECDSCHPKVFEMTRTSGRMTMDDLYAGKFCGHCHNGRGAFSSQDCTRCHKGGVKDGGTISWEGGGMGAVSFSHEKHVSMGLACKDCHTRIFGYKKGAKLTMDGMNNGETCGGCHNGKRAFGADACDRCHKMG